MYSSSLKHASNAGDPRRAMKIFYQTVSEPVRLLEKNSSSIDELPLPENAFRILRADLKASTKILPKSASKLHQWDIGLLER